MDYSLDKSLSIYDKIYAQNSQFKEGANMESLNHKKEWRVPIFLLLGIILISSSLLAEIKLPSILGTNMIIQQGKPANIWGKAEPNEKITVQIAEEVVRTTADNKGLWEVTLKSREANGESLQMTISGTKSQKIKLENILVGEVWVCSGQSNMQWSMSQTHSPIPEIQRADYPNIRLFYVPRKISTQPQNDVDAEWDICSPETIGSFSAVAYYFGQEIYNELDVPVGLINSNWGGTRIEPWTPDSEIEPLGTIYKNNLKEALPKLEEWIRKAELALENKTYIHPQPPLPNHPHQNNRTPTVLYNAMIHPLIRFPIRGAIWYQGEANRNDGLEYTAKMEALIKGWRSVWKVGEFPFYFVQLAPFNYGYTLIDDESDILDFYRLPLIWEAQQKTLEIPNTGMAVVSDITNLYDIHPRNKRDVGYRLSLWALAKTYGKTDLVFSGPLYKSMTIEGNKIRISFEYTGSGLKSLNSQPLSWFEIAGENNNYLKAEAVIDGHTVLVWNKRIGKPVTVRFGWHQLAVPNLGNKKNLPASPFRTHR